MGNAPGSSSGDFSLAGSNPASRTINPFDKPIRKVYGPYRRSYKSGPDRMQMIFVFEDGSKTSMSNARWVMTQHLGRRLGKDEHVDHINENPLDDRIENLQLLSRGDNNRKSTRLNPDRFDHLKGERGWTHGTIYGWMRKKCKCDVCLEAKRAWSNERNEKRRKPKSDGGRGPYKRRS